MRETEERDKKISKLEYLHTHIKQADRQTES